MKDNLFSTPFWKIKVPNHQSIKEKYLQSFIDGYEKKIFDLFDNIIFISKNEFSKIKYIDEKNKILNIENSFDIKKKVFNYNKNNFKIFFIGNINYLPNKLACYNFAKNILPKINKKKILTNIDIDSYDVTRNKYEKNINDNVTLVKEVDNTKYLNIYFKIQNIELIDALEIIQTYCNKL